MIFFGAAVLGYLLGSIPFGLLITRAAGLGDIRAIGSGNIGATNVLRTGRRGLAFATLFFDAGKGFAAVLLGDALAPGLGLLAGLAAMVGHAFPAWLGFKGGKGVATGLGVFLGAAWWLGVAAAVAWGMGFAATRISSVGALAACAAAPVVALVAGEWELAGFAAAVAGLVAWRHRGNVARLRAGTEPRVNS